MKKAIWVGVMVLFVVRLSYAGWFEDAVKSAVEGVGRRLPARTKG
jgi:hypothetical protein